MERSCLQSRTVWVLNTGQDAPRIISVHFLKELKDIRKIRIDRNHTKEKRIAQYLRQVGNPYLVCIGNVKVKIRFANNGVSFEDAFEELLLSV